MANTNSQWRKYYKLQKGTFHLAPVSLAKQSLPLPTDAKLRVESSLLELYRGAKEEKPPLGGLKGDLGGMSI